MTERDPVVTAVAALVAAIADAIRQELQAQTRPASLLLPPRPRRSAPAPGDDCEGPILLTLPETRARLRVSKATVDRMVSRGTIRAVKIGSRTFIPAKEIARIIDGD